MPLVAPVACLLRQTLYLHVTTRIMSYRRFTKPSHCLHCAGSKSHRQHGSIGNSATPSRVFPNLQHAGHMGYERVSNKKLKVLLVDTERGAIVVKGSVPGKSGNLLEITPAKIVGKTI